MTTRRNFLKASGVAGATLLLPWPQHIKYAFAQSGSLVSSTLTKFIDPPGEAWPDMKMSNR